MMWYRSTCGGGIGLLPYPPAMVEGRGREFRVVLRVSLASSREHVPGKQLHGKMFVIGYVCMYVVTNKTENKSLIHTYIFSPTEYRRVAPTYSAYCPSGRRNSFRCRTEGGLAVKWSYIHTYTYCRSCWHTYCTYIHTYIHTY